MSSKHTPGSQPDFDPDILFQIKADDYGDKYQDHILEQYKLYTEMADRISSRRVTSNSFFLSINASLLTILGFFLLPQTSINILVLSWTGIVACVGVIICLGWLSMLQSYRALNAAKFEVINTLELKLPSAGFTVEWEILKSHRKYGKHIRFTGTESLVPIIIAILYVGMLLVMVCLYVTSFVT